jgi:hypothetical protein
LARAATEIQAVRRLPQLKQAGFQVLVRNKQQAEDLGALAKTQTMQAAMEAAAAARAALL